MILQDHLLLMKYFKELNLVEKLKENSLEILESQEFFNNKFIDYSFDIRGSKALSIANTVTDSFYGYCRRKKDEKGYRLGCTLPIEGTFFNEEYDRCTDAIELYSKVYKDKISESGIASNDLKKGLRNFEFQEKKL